MVQRQTSNGYILRLEYGDSINEKLVEFAKSSGIKAASFYGLGAVTEAELGYYNLEEQEYSVKKFNELMEIISITGNISMLDEEQFVHAHVVLSKADYSAIGGHLKNAKVAATCEIFVTVYDKTLARKHDEEVGLNLLEL